MGRPRRRRRGAGGRLSARVLVVATDVVGERMAGPGIRAWELARALAREHAVTLAAPAPLPPAAPVALVEATRSQLARIDADVLVAQPVALQLFPDLAVTPARKVIDLYDPAIIEGLEFSAGEPAGERWRRHEADLAALRTAAAAGDLFLCASERQRHYWLGALSALGRVNPLTYAGDADLDRLLRVVPFGVPDEPPAPGPGLRGKIAGIGPDDRILLWAGGIWNWFDPETLIRAVARAAAAVPSLRLVFMGAGHPNPSVPRMAAATRARRLAKDLGLEGEHVFFLPTWLPYAERGAVLAGADVGAVLHRPGVETTLAFRTRVLDHLWAGLPSILAAGDTLSELAEREGFGLVVPPGDVTATADAIERLLTDAELAAGCRQAARRVAEAFRWTVVTRPLAEYCAAPWASPDRERVAVPAAPPAGRPGLRRAWRALRREGPTRFASRAYRYLRRAG